MQVEQREGYAIITPPEVIDFAADPGFRGALQSLYDAGYTIINVDCKDLKMISSAGIGSLVLFNKKLNGRGGKLRLINVNNDYVRHLFDMIDLKRVIPVE